MPIKNEEEACEKIIEMSNNNDYTTDKLLDYWAYFKENYRLIVADLSKRTKLKDPQQINFIGKLENNHGATMFSSMKNQTKQLSIFLKILAQSYK